MSSPNSNVVGTLDLSDVGVVFEDRVFVFEWRVRVAEGGTGTRSRRITPNIKVRHAT